VDKTVGNKLGRKSNTRRVRVKSPVGRMTRGVAISERLPTAVSQARWPVSFKMIKGASIAMTVFAPACLRTNSSTSAFE